MTASNLLDKDEMEIQLRKRIAELEKSNQDLCAENITLTHEISKRKQAEEALLESEERYRAFFNTSAMGIVEIDLTGRIIKVNERYCKITGYSHEELLGMNVAELSHPDDRDYDRKKLADYLSGKTQTFDVEKRYVLKGSRIIWVQVTAAIVRDKEGRPLRSIGMVQDITERKQAEEALLETETCRKVAEAVEIERRRLFDVLETLPAMICLLTPDYHYVFTNRSFLEKFGELDGRHCYEFCFGLTKPCEFCEAYKVLETGKPHQWEVTTPDGSVIDVYNFPFTDIDGSPLILEMNIDITERKQLEEQIRQRAEELEMIMDIAPVAIFVAHDPQGCNITGNRKASEYSEAEVGENVSASVVPGRRFFCNGRELTAEELPNQQAALKNIDVRDVEIDYLLPSGQRRVVLGSASPLHDSEGHVRGSVGAFIDITERVQAEEALAKVEEVRIKEIHHRIKNNLQIISSLLSLQAEKFTDPKMLEAFKESQNRVASMALIHQELYQGKGTDNLDFAAYVEKLTQELFSSYNLRNEDISLKLNLEQAYLNVDTAIPVGMIANELISNSLKYAFPDGKKWEISITLKRTENLDINKEASNSECNQEKFQYTLTVADNGIGIPEETDLEDIYSLGLQLVNLLVEQVDGCIELRRNHGTEFTIWFNDVEK